MSINLKVPDMKELKPRITVFGVGGAGGNAVNNMINSNLQGVEFVVANTDAQALAMSGAERRIQMGTAITEGLGAGSKPETGAAAAEEAIDEIKSQLTGSHMVFITAGMGGGTGTGAAPVIAKASYESDILTVGVVTKPFQFEGKHRMSTAENGIRELSQYVDTLLVIPNQNLFRVATEKTTFADAFALADQVLHSGVACITDLMVKEGLINLDFADVKTVMQGMGKAMMGTGEASGDKRAVEAAEAAISNPLLDDVSMQGASGLLISITGGNDLTLYEVDEAASRIREEVDSEANIILGATFDESLSGQIRVSVVATGLDSPVEEAVPQTPKEEKGVESLSQRIASLKTEDSGAPSRPAASQSAPQPAPRPASPAASAPANQPAAGDAGWKAPDDVTIEKRAPQPQMPPRPAASDADGREAAKKREAFVPQPPSVARKEPRRMPSTEDFPEVVQKELQALKGDKPREQEQEEVGLGAQKKKVGFFERLANVGRGKAKDVEISREREPDFDSRRQPAQEARSAAPERPAAPNAPAAQAGQSQKASKTRLARGAGAPKQASKPVSVQQEEDDEDLEIPAFLRRQAN